MGAVQPLNPDWLCTSALTPERLLGGGGGAAVPNGLLLRHCTPMHEVFRGTVKGCSAVTPKGPLMPSPALGENSVKNSPRSAYSPKPARTTRFFTKPGVQAMPMRDSRIHSRPVNVKSYLQKEDLVPQNCL